MCHSGCFKANLIISFLFFCEKVLVKIITSVVCYHSLHYSIIAVIHQSKCQQSEKSNNIEWCYESSFHLRDLMKGSQWHQGFHRPHSENCCFEWRRVSLNWPLPLPPLHFGKSFFLSWTPCLPKLNWGPCAWTPLGENSPSRKWCQRVSSVWEGRWGDRCFPLELGTVCTWRCQNHS